MDNKTRIIQEAKTLFMRLGIRSVSMDDIASHLGMSKKTIYQLFADKDNLVDSVIEVDIKQRQMYGMISLWIGLTIVGMFVQSNLVGRNIKSHTRK